MLPSIEKGDARNLKSGIVASLTLLLGVGLCKEWR